MWITIIDCGEISNSESKTEWHQFRVDDIISIIFCLSRIYILHVLSRFAPYFRSSEACAPHQTYVCLLVQSIVFSSLYSLCLLSPSLLLWACRESERSTLHGQPNKKKSSFSFSLTFHLLFFSLFSLLFIFILTILPSQFHRLHLQPLSFILSDLPPFFNLPLLYFNPSFPFFQFFLFYYPRG